MSARWLIADCGVVLVPVSVVLSGASIKFAGPCGVLLCVHAFSGVVSFNRCVAAYSWRPPQLCELSFGPLGLAGNYQTGATQTLLFQPNCAIRNVIAGRLFCAGSQTPLKLPDGLVVSQEV